MRTVGEILKKARGEKKLSLEDISAQTKITVPYLEAIESNDYDALPASAFTKGFLQNYAKMVDLNPQHILAIFRRDYDQDEKGNIVPRAIADTSRRSIDWFSPRTSWIGVTVIIGVLVLGFFARQIWLFRAAPPLSLDKPLAFSQVTSPVQVSGNTLGHVSVTINNRPVEVTEDGAFLVELPLTVGQHTLIVVAESRSNKMTTIERTIEVVEE